MVKIHSLLRPPTTVQGDSTVCADACCKRGATSYLFPRAQVLAKEKERFVPELKRKKEWKLNARAFATALCPYYRAD